MDKNQEKEESSLQNMAPILASGRAGWRTASAPWSTKLAQSMSGSGKTIFKKVKVSTLIRQATYTKANSKQEAMMATAKWHM